MQLLGNLHPPVQKGRFSPAPGCMESSHGQPQGRCLEMGNLLPQTCAVGAEVGRMVPWHGRGVLVEQPCQEMVMLGAAGMGCSASVHQRRYDDLSLRLLAESDVPLQRFAAAWSQSVSLGLVDLPDLCRRSDPLSAQLSHQTG